MKPEAKVGTMFIITVILVAVFAFALGVINPFSNSYDLNLAYNYAGGIEVGSPVRVMGIKVGRVKEIKFDPNLKAPNGDEAKLRITITVSKDSWDTIRSDSQFFINLAGVIGEKFIEVSPGSLSAEKLKPGQLVRGEDPPRIDQLISQGYGLAGKVMDMINKNEGSVVDTIKMMNNLVTNLNSLLKQIDATTSNKDARQMLKNLVTITSDMAFFTEQLRSEDSQKTFALMKTLIWRLEPLDAKTLRKFLQEEGIKARLF
jgi:phospholipid/cholesterol/gamma-HCH transport system substrate-binding protein